MTFYNFSGVCSLHSKLCPENLTTGNHLLFINFTSGINQSYLYKLMLLSYLYFFLSIKNKNIMNNKSIIEWPGINKKWITICDFCYYSVFVSYKCHRKRKIQKNVLRTWQSFCFFFIWIRWKVNKNANRW